MENLCKVYELFGEVHQSYRWISTTDVFFVCNYIICTICVMDVSENGNVSKIS